MTRSMHEREKRNSIWKGERESIENKKRFLYLFLFYYEQTCLFVICECYPFGTIF